MNEREFAEYVNRITSLARTYANHQSLRERVSFELTQFFAESVEREERLKTRVTRMEKAIEAMRTAGGSEEFQTVFDRAKELVSAI